MTEPPPRVQAAESRRTLRYLLAASSIGAWASRNYQRTKAEDDLAQLEIAVVELSYNEWLDVIYAIQTGTDPDLLPSDGVMALVDALDQQGLPNG